MYIKEYYAEIRIYLIMIETTFRVLCEHKELINSGL